MQFCKMQCTFFISELTLASLCSRTYYMVSIWHLLSELLNHSEFTKQVAAYAALPWCLPSFFLLFPSLCHLILPSQLHHLKEAFPSTLKLGEVFVFCDL